MSQSSLQKHNASLNFPVFEVVVSKTNAYTRLVKSQFLIFPKTTDDISAVVLDGILRYN